MLIFIEDKSLSNEYRQVIINDEQYAKMTEFIMSLFESREINNQGDRLIEMKESITTYKLPDIRSTYEN